MSISKKNRRPTATAAQSTGQTPGRLFQEAYQHHRAGRLRAAEAMYRKVLALKPDLAEAHNQLGVVLIVLDRSEEAVHSITRSLEITPNSSHALNNLGTAFKKLGRTEDAISSFERALQIAPSNLNTHMNLAVILEVTGQLDKAIEHYRQVIKIKPDFAQAHFLLAHMRNHISSADEINAMKSLYSQPGTSINQRVYLAFGLGSALDKHGTYDEAFDYFQAGHRFKSQSIAFDLADQARLFKSVTDVFNKDFLVQYRAVGPSDDLPIFIFGMPRSGTSLAEQILASHPRIQGAGELSYIGDVVQRAIKITGKMFPIGWGNIGAQEIHALGSNYLEKLRAQSDGSKHITDTTPMNFIFVGLIATILPGARLVHCRREPMDTCLSIFQQPLSESHAYAHDLADLGGFYQLYKKLMTHWGSVLPGRIYDLCYEDLVTNSETEIRKLLDYCNLPFHEDCLTFHRTERSVQTPSASQVRQPIYTSSIGRWRRYEAKLSPLMAILQ